MFRRILLTALGAGAFVGVVLTALQLAITSPMIVAAERYETAAASSAAAAEGHETAEAGEDGLTRHAFTGIATMLSAIGFGLALTAFMAIRGRPIDGRVGLLWGLAGFATVTLAPALGLAPELPASAAGDLGARQAWWWATVAATGAGLALIAFSGNLALRAGGAVLMVLPHLVGAPEPEAFTSPVPAELAAAFAAASIVLGAVFWALLGWSSGTVWRRLAPPGQP